MSRCLLVILLFTWCQGPFAFGQNEWWPLHVFAFLDISKGGPPGESDAVHKTGPDELLAISQLLLGPGRLQIPLSLPVPRELLFLDAVELPEVETRPAKHRNPLLDLKYSVSALDDGDPERNFCLRGKLGEVKFDRNVSLERGKVHLVRFSEGLFLILTPDRSISRTPLTAGRSRLEETSRLQS